MFLINLLICHSSWFVCKSSARVWTKTSIHILQPKLPHKCPITVRSELLVGHGSMLMMLYNRCNIYVQKYDQDMNTWNVYRESENTQNTWRLALGSGTKLLFTFLSLRFFDMKRERHNFFLCWHFHLNPPRAASAANYWSGLGEASSENRLSCSEFVFFCLFVFFKFQNPQRFRAWRHSRPRSHFPIWVFYWDISDCHIRRTCAWTPALNVCT